MKWLTWLLASGLLLAACAPPPSTAPPEAASINVARLAAETSAALPTASAPSGTPQPSATRWPTPTRTSTPTRTPRPSVTASNTVAPSDTPTATPVPPTRVPATLAPPSATLAPTPDFVALALAVRAQIDNYVWQIDLAARIQGGYFLPADKILLKGEARDLNCAELMRAYDYVAERTTLTVPPSLAGPYDLYSRGVTLFVADGLGLYQICQSFLADPSVDRLITGYEWQTARDRGNQARILLTDAIIAAGGTP